MVSTFEASCYSEWCSHIVKCNFVNVLSIVVDTSVMFKSDV
jgi:hypothetical protein